jgi:broad specificity phosphatase PhoE
MTDLFAVRHGESPSRDIYWGTSPTPLSEKGIETARVLSGKLGAAGIAKIAHSPQLRAEQTAQLIRNGLPGPVSIVADHRLAAKDYGVFNGQPKAKVALSRTNYSTDRERLLWAPEGGENYWSVFLRVISFVVDLDRSMGNWLVITHEGVIRVFMCLLNKSASYLNVDVDYGALVDLSALVEDVPDRIAWLNDLQRSLRIPTAVG